MERLRACRCQLWLRELFAGMVAAEGSARACKGAVTMRAILWLAGMAARSRWKPCVLVRIASPTAVRSRGPSAATKAAPYQG